MLQSLIILPLEEQDYSQIGKYYKTFLKEWIKIENQISNEFYNLYILESWVILQELQFKYISPTIKGIEAFPFIKWHDRFTMVPFNHFDRSKIIN